MAIFALGGVVYLAISGCIVYLKSDYFNFDKVWIYAVVEKLKEPFGES
jgi:hypothetical protein